MIEKYIEQIQNSYVIPGVSIQEEEEKNIILALMAGHISPSEFEPFLPLYIELLRLTLLASEDELQHFPKDQKRAAARQHAAKLAIAFGDYTHAINFLKHFEAQTKQSLQSSLIIHDACLFNLPDSPTWSVKFWQSIVISNFPSRPNDLIFRVLTFANKIETYVNENRQQLHDRLKETVRQQVYVDYEQSLSLEYEKTQKQPATEQEWIEERISSQDKKVKEAQNQRFDIYLKKQMGIPLNEGLTEEQKKAIAERKKKPIVEDTVQLDIIKRDVNDDFRQKAKNAYKNKPNITPNITKQEFIAKGLKKHAKTMESIIEDKIQTQLFSTSTPLATLIRYASANSYNNAQKNPDAAANFFEYGLPEKVFNQYLGLEPKDDPEKIPNVYIEGAEISPDYKDFYIAKLSPHANRMAFLGELTGCCQSLGKEGEQCAIHAITSPLGGAYVLYRKNKPQAGNRDAIMAQCWAWRSKENYLVLDSIESQIDFRGEHLTLISDFNVYLAKHLSHEYGIPSILVGSGGHTPSELGFETQSLGHPVDYSDEAHRDSRKQKVIVNDKIPFLVDAYILLNETSRLKLSKSFDMQGIPDWIQLCNENKMAYLKYIILPLIQNTPEELNAVSPELSEAIKNPNMIIDAFSIAHVSAKYNNTYIDFSLLHLCVLERYFFLAKWLATKGADINIQSADGTTPLLLAARNKDWEMFKFLITLGADFSKKLPQQLTQLVSHFVKDHNLVITDQNLLFFAYLVDQYRLRLKKGAAGSLLLSILALAAPQLKEQDDNYSPIDISNLVESYISLDERNILKGSISFSIEDIISWAEFCDQNNISYMKYLILPLIKNSPEELEQLNSPSVLDLAKALRNPNMPIDDSSLLLLSKKYTNFYTSMSLLHLCTLENYTSLAKWLAANGADLNSRSENIGEEDTTPLHWALRGTTEIAALLIFKGAKYTEKDQSKVLALAVKDNNLELLKSLLSEFKADVNTHINGNNLLSLAFVHRSPQIIEWLLNNGADINIEVAGEPVLHSAISSGQFEAIHLLLHKGADPNKENKQGTTPLMAILPLDPTIHKNKWEIVKLLLEAGANPNSKSRGSELSALTFTTLYCRNRYEPSQNIPEEIYKLMKQPSVSGYPNTFLGSRSSPHDEVPPSVPDQNQTQKKFRK